MGFPPSWGSEPTSLDSSSLHLTLFPGLVKTDTVAQHSSARAALRGPPGVCHLQHRADEGPGQGEQGPWPGEAPGWTRVPKELVGMGTGAGDPGLEQECQMLSCEQAQGGAGSLALHRAGHRKMNVPQFVPGLLFLKIVLPDDSVQIIVRVSSNHRQGQFRCYNKNTLDWAA